MRNLTKVAIAMFCSGVLLGGIGTGVAVVEYSSLEYTGNHVFGEEDMKTEKLDLVIQPKEGKKILVEDSGYRHRGSSFDSTIPENTIRYVITYNEKLVTPSIRYENYEETDTEENSYEGMVWLRNYYYGDDFGVFMKNKDQILGELKRGQIGSYRMESIKSIDVLVHPGLQDFVVFR